MRRLFLSLRFLIVVAGLLLASISMLIGFRLDSKGFLENLLAGFVDLIFGIIITYIIIEQYLKSQKEKERRNIRAFTQISISMDLLFIINKFCITIPITGAQPLLGSIAMDISIRQGTISKDTVDLLGQYIDSINTNLHDLRPSITDKHISDFYEAVEPNINYITDVLIPRIIEFSEDYNLNEIFIVFEQMLIDARSDYSLFKQGVISKEKMFDFTLSILNGSRNVLSSIGKRIKF